MYDQELAGLELSVRTLEQHVRDLRAAISKENATIPKALALLSACEKQERNLQHIASNMPQCPAVTREDCHNRDQQRSTSVSASVVGGSLGGDLRSSTHGLHRGPSGQLAPSNPAAGSAAPADLVRKKKEVPRRYVTEGELAGVASYMKGRLTVEKVKAAVDEVASHAETNWRLVHGAKNANSKGLTAAERKRGNELLHGVANKEGVKGQHFFLESDLKDGTALKLDKTGKSLLTVLRHLGRLTEVRCSVEGMTVVVFVLLPPPGQL
ncbi:MAG: hypothetical protein WDW38_002359 [Sanguina aurantia]